MIINILKQIIRILKSFRKSETIRFQQETATDSVFLTLW